MDSCKAGLILKNLKSKIGNYFKLLERAKALTEDILRFAKEGEYDRADLESQNRNRLINITLYIQKSIETSIKAIPKDFNDEEINSTIKKWYDRPAKMIHQIEALDLEILDHLNRSKKQIGLELKALYKVRAAHRKYNLSAARG